MTKFTEEKLEQAIIALLGEQGFPYCKGESIDRQPHEVLIKEDLRQYLARRYEADLITENEIDSVIRLLEALPAADLYESNRCWWRSCGKWNRSIFAAMNRIAKGQIRAALMAKINSVISRLWLLAVWG